MFAKSQIIDQTADYTEGKTTTEDPSEEGWSEWSEWTSCQAGRVQYRGRNCQGKTECTYVFIELPYVKVPLST